MMLINFLATLWRFGRPHTIIGSIVSIITLWMLALRGNGYVGNYGLLIGTLIVGIACNIFIVGLNQIIDIEVDKINKPKLPLADGSLKLSSAYNIVWVSLTLTLLLGFYISFILGCLILLICLIGVAYSVPPIQLKKHHLPAALAITLVRGLLVNFGMFLHFTFTSRQQKIYNVNAIFSENFPAELLALTGFVLAFSIAIAWFKDLPDVVGDKVFKIKTFALLYSPKLAFRSGLVLVSIAYIATIIWAFYAENIFLLICHLIASLTFVVQALKVDLSKPDTVSQFYMIFWIFFFAEYLFFASWCLI